MKDTAMRNRQVRERGRDSAGQFGLGYLTEPDRAAMRLAESRRRLEGKLARCRRLTAAYGSVRRGSGGDSEADLAELADLIEDVRQRQEAVRTARRQLRWMLAKLAAAGGKGERSAVLLEQRYLLRRTWPQVREALREEGFSAGTDRTLFNWHREALRLLEEAE